MSLHQVASMAAVSGGHCELAIMSSVPLRATSFSFHFPVFCPSTCSPLSRSRDCHPLPLYHQNPRRRNPEKQKVLRVDCAAGQPLKVIILGAPASGKGTQCRMIVEKYGLVHISTGDILRAEVSSGTEIGNKAKEYMDNGMLVPDEIVTDMVLTRLSLPDVKERGWLLDGYPRSFSQAQSLEKANIKPDICIVLDVPDEILIDRCVGRRIDPVTRKIYHLKNLPPETDEISARLIARADDTQEKAESRLETYKRNVEAILPLYMDLLKKIDGNGPKDVVFDEVDFLFHPFHADAIKSKKLSTVEGDSVEVCTSTVSFSTQKKWRGIPTRLNNIPHSKEIREYFYNDVLEATLKAIEDKRSRLKVEINIPELNPEMDVYRIGTLMELVRTLALSFADDGKHVKVCVQGSMGEGALAGMPLQLAGSRRILEFMDWGKYGAKDTFITIGSIGAKEIDEQVDIYILVSPQNAVGNCIINDLQAMTDAAGQCPVILINPRLKDLPGSSGIMQIMGRDKRLEYASSFINCYFFRLLYYAGTQYPIMGAIRMSYSHDYELFKRIDDPSGKEKYVIIARFPLRPTIEEINDAFEGKIRRSKEKWASGLWSFFG
ncbi:adenylate kinase 5, chloroplastic-like isoform X2 [Phalaenopsis equestris]|uniref:adenylate kinase 5, chloroplastic-like isoform X2 n=1 Tax=Phalaenopsis equestris TaxID=78828 RepID=UPI0009E520B1|nr:adenylate kinase 5, chloroplastic-like isoform X2 [Phalaenopsis equestris]